jgi:tetratricopeptide (TPR) repeat protein
MAFMANNLGVFLSDIDLPEDAFRYYKYAYEIDPANISALLNLFAMIARGYHPELKAEIERDLRAKVADPKQRYALWSLSRTYGYVRNYDMFMQMGWSWALSSSPGAVLAGLRSEYALNQTDERRTGLAALMASIYEMRGDREQSAGMYRLTMKDDPKNTAAISGLVRLALQQSMVDEARKILEEGENAGASKIQLRQDWAALYMISGDLPRARVLLQELADEQNAPVMTLAMLAMVMLEQNDLASVEAVMLPKIAKASGGNDTYFSLVIQGQIWQKKGKPFFRNALACFQRAALLRPDIQALQDVMLVLVTAMGDQAVAEARAYAILSRRPADTYANFIIGSIRLEQGHCREAETYLRTSAANPAASIFVFNNLAQTLARLGKLEEALTIAEANSIKYPDRYEVWSTMAFLMVSAGRFEEAEKALGKAHALNQEDKRIFIIDAQLAIKRNDLEAAQKDLAKIAATDLLSAIDRADYASVKESIAHLRARQ